MKGQKASEMFVQPEPPPHPPPVPVPLVPGSVCENANADKCVSKCLSARAPACVLTSARADACVPCAPAFAGELCSVCVCACLCVRGGGGAQLQPVCESFGVLACSVCASAFVRVFVWRMNKN